MKRRYSLAAATVAADAGASSTGPNSPGTAVSDSTVGTFSFASPSRVVADDSDWSQASTLTAGTGISEYLKATNFSFGLAGTETIQGVRVEALAWGDGNLGDIKDHSIKLVKADTISGISLDDGAGFTISGDGTVYKSWGGGLQMWGLSISASDVNDTGFGCALSFKNTNALTTRSVLIDHIRMTVYWT